MNEQPQAPPKPKPPSGNNGAPRPRRRPAQTSQSRESRFIGYLVLGFGVVAVLAVLIMAFGRKDVPVNKDAPKPASANEIKADLGNSTGSSTAAPSPIRSDLFFERDPDFDAGDMEGDWQTTIGRYTAVLQVRKGVYQIILAGPNPNTPRFYSTGTMKVTEDIIMLNPRMDWPPPKSPAGKVVVYTKLTRAPFPVIAKFDGGKMLWQNVPQEEKRVSAPFTSPLFKSENVKLAIWQPLK